MPAVNMALSQRAGFRGRPRRSAGFWRRREVLGAPFGSEERAGKTTLRVLLADDNPVNRILGSSLLEKRGHSVVLAENGEEVLERLRMERFDVVLMDISMPRMTGVEATRRIRAGLQGVDPSIPIIALTTHALKGDRERFLAAGMDDYVSKPIDQARFDEALGRVIAALARFSRRERKRA